MTKEKTPEQKVAAAMRRVQKFQRSLRKAPDWKQKLRDDFGLALAATVPFASEKEALNEALDIADEWKDRVNEIRQFG